MPCKVWPLRVQTGQIRQGAASAAYGKIGSPGKRCRGCLIADRGLWPLHPDAGGFGQAERRPRDVLRRIFPGVFEQLVQLVPAARLRAIAGETLVAWSEYWLVKMRVGRRVCQVVSAAYHVDMKK